MMPYSQLISRAFEIVRRERALWVMGFILAIFGGGGGANATWQGNMEGFRPFQDTLPTRQIPDWFRVEAIAPLVLAIVCFVVVLAIIALVARSVALAGLIYGADRAEQGRNVRWGELWRAGWSREGRRIIGLNLLLAVPFIILGIVGLIAAATVVLPAARTIISGIDPGPAVGGTLAGVGVAFVCLALLAVLVSLVLHLLGNYAARSIVLEHQPVLAAVSQGWRLLRAHPGETFIFALLLWVIGIGVGILVAVVITVMALVIGVPIFLVLLATEFPRLLLFLLAVPAVLLLLIFSALVQGPVQAYFETAWTLAWRHLTRPAAEEPVPGTL
jgi:hypothetical protein